MQFEWDKNRRQANRAKQGIDFLNALEVLTETPWLVVDARNNYGEERWLTFGEHKGRWLAVAFIIRSNVFRIISARRANTHERWKYGQDA